MTGKDGKTGTAAIGGGLRCDRCGKPHETGDHAECGRARALEPPRFCTQCGRRMVVQVLPIGWHSRCVEHGVAREGRSS